MFRLNRVYIPINYKKNHWILACIFIEDRKIQMYDSYLEPHWNYLNALFSYVKDEYITQRGVPLPDADQWSLVRTQKEVMLEQIGGEKFHHLCLVLIPYTYGGSERDTFLLRQLAKDTCTSLWGAAQIVCHSSIPPWYQTKEGDDTGRSLWECDNSLRQDFLQRHDCLQHDEAQASLSKYCPVGYCGEWCGNLSTCTGGEPGGRIRKIRARNAFYFLPLTFRK